MIKIPPKKELVKIEDLPEKENFFGLKYVDLNDKNMYENHQANAFEFQQSHESYFQVEGLLSLKGNTKDDEGKRLSIISSMPLGTFVSIVKYDPSNPPLDDYQALGMIDAHEKTQADFNGAKKKNKFDFSNYLLEGVRKERSIHLPVISGWQSSEVFSDTVFVSYHEISSNTCYGCLFIPKSPIMQSDGQTQTAALFAVAQNKEAVEQLGALKNLMVTLEVELNVDVVKAAQAFADRNGRGSKKNKNLVIGMDTAAPLSKIRANVILNTVFEGRIADGRTGGCTQTSTENIVDLSTFEQLLGIALTGPQNLKAEQFKAHHVKKLEPFAKEFVNLLSDKFSEYWRHPSGKGEDAYRKLYVIGWPFALKGIALAYFYSKQNELDVIKQAMLEPVPANENAEDYFAQQCLIKNTNKQSLLSLDELSKRLDEINWFKHKKHWIKITGYSENPDGSKRTWKLKSLDNKAVVKGLNQNQLVLVTKVANQITGSNWTSLCSEEDEPL